MIYKLLRLLLLLPVRLFLVFAVLVNLPIIALLCMVITHTYEDFKTEFTGTAYVLLDYIKGK